MKIDPYKSKEGYLRWKEQAKSGIPEIGRKNTELLLGYVQDMEIGINVGIGAKKGARSFIHLNSLRDRLIPLMKRIKEVYNLDSINEITEEQILSLFLQGFLALVSKIK